MGCHDLEGAPPSGPGLELAFLEGLDEFPDARESPLMRPRGGPLHRRPLFDPGALIGGLELRGGGVFLQGRIQIADLLLERGDPELALPAGTRGPGAPMLMY